MATRGSDDDRPTVDLGPRPPEPELADDPQTVLDDGQALQSLDDVPSVDADLMSEAGSITNSSPAIAPMLPVRPSAQPGIMPVPGPQPGPPPPSAISDGLAAAATLTTPLPRASSSLPFTRMPAAPPAESALLVLAAPPAPPALLVPAAPAAPADAVHHLPTQQLPQPRALTAGSKTHASATTTSPVDAMKFDEIARTRVFLKVVSALTLGGIIVALSTVGDHVAKVVVLVGSGAAALGSLFLLVILRDPASYVPRKLLIPALPIVFGSMSGVYYWGAGSPVAAMLVYGIYFFSLGSDRQITRFMYTLVAATHGVLGLGILSGVLVDHGVVQIGALGAREQIAILGIIEVLYFAAYYTARVSQRVTLDAMQKLEQAVRGNAQRDALLAEARAELDRALKIGGPGRFTDQIIGSFRLGVLIGRGGMGEVYEAHGVADRREAAVKLLHAGTLADAVHVQRFLREAQIAARIDCPHVVRVLEVGTTAGEIPFLAMERLRGNDLAHQLRRQRRLQPAQAKVLVDQLAIGLEAARTAGIVHRDLKPHNVFFAEENGLRRWKILDFGVSKAGGSGTLTQGHVVGTPAYMAPEQARGEDVDHRADVYSLAAIIFRSITGHPVFTGKDVPTTLYDVVYRVPTRPSMLAQLSDDVDRVLAIGLAKDPRERFAFAFALELARWFSAAVTGGLELEQRRRADELIARYPWGTRPGVATTP